MPGLFAIKPRLPPASPLPPHGVVVTRPRDSADPLVRALQRRGARVLRLPAQTIETNAAFDWPSARAGQRTVDRWIFTSPAAVQHARPLLDDGLDAPVIAVGTATAAALRRSAIEALVPTGRQDSEGLLEVSALAHVENHRIVIIGAPDGRGLIAATLRQRGARVEEWPVYRRGLPRWSARELLALDATSDPLLTMISSADSLQNLMRLLPAPVWNRLRESRWIASSERLAGSLRDAGACAIDLAASATTADLVKAAMSRLKR